MMRKNLSETEKKVLEFVAMATPANSNLPRPMLRAASSAKVDALVAQLNAMKPRARTFECPTPSRIVTPAPWVRRQMAIAGAL